MLRLTIRFPRLTLLTALSVAALLVMAIPADAGDFLSAQYGYVVQDQEPESIFVSHDALGTEIASYGSGGLQIRDLANNGALIAELGFVPEDYISAYTGYVWNSFTTLDPSGNSVWVGFTNLGNSDDRIYEVDRTSQTPIWTCQTTLTGNSDLEFFGTAAYVVANDGGMGTANAAIYKLGTDNPIANLGGYSAGLDFDSQGNLYYLCQSDSTLVRFDAADVAAASPADPLTLADAATLLTLPTGGWDVEVDSADHVLFNVNESSNFVAMLTGSEAAGWNYVKLASETSERDIWLTSLSVAGDATSWGNGAVYATAMDNDTYDYCPGAAEIRLAWRPGDLDGDDFVGGADLDIIRAYWGQKVTVGDLLSGDASRDGFVGGADLDIVRANWGLGTPPPGSVPEPAVPTLLLLGALGWLACRRLGR